MTLMDKYLRFLPVWNAEGGGSGGGEGGEQAAASPESILYGNEGKETDVSNPAGNEGDDKSGGGGDWKEYEPDPNKSDEENDAAKAEHDKNKPAGDDDNKSDDPLDKVPDDGKYTLTMPEGVQVDQELLDAVGADFKELGLTHKQAQQLADKFIEVNTKRAEKQAEQFAETITKWGEDAKKDKEIGGANWDGSVKDARRAIDTLGTPELKNYLEITGGGNHPEIIRLFAKVGSMIKEDSPANGGAEGAGKPADPAHVLYPNDAPKG